MTCTSCAVSVSGAVTCLWPWVSSQCSGRLRVATFLEHSPRCQQLGQLWAGVRCRGTTPVSPVLPTQGVRLATPPKCLLLVTSDTFQLPELGRVLLWERRCRPQRAQPGQRRPLCGHDGGHPGSLLGGLTSQEQVFRSPWGHCFVLGWRSSPKSRRGCIPESEGCVRCYPLWIKSTASFQLLWTWCLRRGGDAGLRLRLLAAP